MKVKLDTMSLISAAIAIAIPRRDGGDPDRAAAAGRQRVLLPAQDAQRGGADRAEAGDADAQRLGGRRKRHAGHARGVA